MDDVSGVAVSAAFVACAGCCAWVWVVVGLAGQGADRALVA